MLELVGLSAGHGRGAAAVKVVHGVDLTIAAGETVAVIGESGSGKSTLARAIVGLAPILSGQLILDGRPVPHARDARFRSAVQMVFQSPAASLNPKMRIGATLREAIDCAGQAGRSAGSLDRLMEATGIAREWAARVPRQLSGGQLQRVAIARALAVEPRLMIADEITSALDLSVQAAILNMLADIRVRTGLAMLFITHDLAVARHMSSKVIVMRNGRIVEAGPTARVLETPENPYTAALVAAESGSTADWKQP